MADDIDPRALRALLETSRVTKRLHPGVAGTKKLLGLHGTALVCVRYRQDALRLIRFTTVELLIDARVKDGKRFDRSTFGIALRPNERDLRLAAIAAGAQWHEDDGLWWLRGAAIRRLGVLDRIRSR